MELDKKTGKGKKTKEFLTAILKASKKQRLQFIDDLMRDKSKLNGCLEQFMSSFAARRDFCNWYYDYLLVYSEWFRHKFESGNVKDVLAMIPCISPWAFEGKCQAREMGELPQVLGKRKDFQNIFIAVLCRQTQNNLVRKGIKHRLN